MIGIGRGGPLGPGTGGHAAAVAAAAGGAPGAGAHERSGATRAAAGAQRPPVASAAGLGGPLSEREAWIALAAVDGLGPVGFGVLVRAFGSARRVLEVGSARCGPARLVAAAAAEELTLGAEVATAIQGARDGAPALLARLAALGLTAITTEEEAYPPRLRSIELPPPALFVRGDPEALAAPRAVAMVGTRRPTDDGRRTATRLAGALAAAGATVISGLAVGIDGAAHAGALLADGCTVAVLGSGHARLYPPAHAELAREIVRTGGAVIAELPPDVDPRQAGFPRRNRIIAGLADATIVVEAGERSGALITASWALEQGRAVYAVPGPLDRPQAVGCNRLLREHHGEVRLVAGPDELLEDLGYGVPVPVRRPRRERSEAARPEPGAILARLGPAEAAVVRRLLAGATTADALAAAADLAPATVLAVLTRLEEEGLVAGTFGRYHLAGALAGVRAGAVPAGTREPGGGGHP